MVLSQVKVSSLKSNQIQISGELTKG